MLLWVILLVAAAVGLYAIIIFNSLVRTRWPMRPGAGSTSSSNATPFRTRPIGPRPLSPFSRPLRDDRFLDNVRSLTPAVGEGPSVHCHRPLARWSLSLAAEVISSFDSDVRLAKDGELTVTETVRVQAEGRDIRHRIYRDFPLTFKEPAASSAKWISASSASSVTEDRKNIPQQRARHHPHLYRQQKHDRSRRRAHVRLPAIGRDGRCAGSTANRS